VEDGMNKRHAEMIAIYQRGDCLTMGEVARLFGVTHQAVSQMFKKYGIKRDQERLTARRAASHRDRVLRLEVAADREIGWRSISEEGDITPGKADSSYKSLGEPSGRAVLRARMRRADRKAEEIVEYYLSHPDDSGNDVARALNIWPIAVTNALRRFGIPPRWRTSLLTRHGMRIRDREICERYLSSPKMNARAVASEFGVSLGAVLNALKRSGIRARPKGFQPGNKARASGEGSTASPC
jgi:hypothetical protein